MTIEKITTIYALSEPESIEYMIIKGQQLETEEGIATYPINIVRNNND